MNLVDVAFPTIRFVDSGLFMTAAIVTLKGGNDSCIHGLEGQSCIWWKKLNSDVGEG
jgi:hypothetical protein